jgi:hypothetical protein
LSSRATKRKVSPRASLVVALATGFVVLQQVVPLVSRLTADPIEPQDFSWDMFGKKVECPVLKAHTVLPDGSLRPLNLERAFPKWAQLRRLLVRDRLERFAQFVCDGMRARHGRAQELHFEVACRNVGEADYVQLSTPERDWCATPSAAQASGP